MFDTVVGRIRSSFNRAWSTFSPVQWVVITAAFAVQLHAIWSCAFLPLQDAPHHMARHYLEYLRLTGRDAPEGYHVVPGLLPNLGGDVVVPLLLLGLPPFVAFKVFVSLCVVMNWIGPTCFILQNGGSRNSSTWAAMLLLPWNFDRCFFLGELNCYLGTGLAFLVLMHFVSIQAKPPSVGRLTLQALFATALFFCHLAPWGIYLVCAATYLVCDAAARVVKHEGWRVAIFRNAMYALPLLPSVALFGLYCWNEQGHPDGSLEAEGWFQMFHKILGVYREVRSYYRWLDVSVLMLWLSAIIIGWSWSVRSLTNWSWVQVALANLTLLYLVAPNFRSSDDADQRLLPAMIVLGVVLIARLPIRRVRAVGAILVVCLAVRYGAVEYKWHTFSRKYQDWSAAFKLIKPRSRICPLLCGTDLDDSGNGIFFCHWAVPSRDAFVAGIYAKPGPIALEVDRPGIEYCRINAAGVCEIVDAALVERDFDYVWCYNPSGCPVRIPETFRKVFESGATSLWEVR